MSETPPIRYETVIFIQHNIGRQTSNENFLSVYNRKVSNKRDKKKIIKKIPFVSNFSSHIRLKYQENRQEKTLLSFNF